MYGAYFQGARFGGPGGAPTHLSLCRTKLAGEMLCYTHAHLFFSARDLPSILHRLRPQTRPDLAIHKFTALMEAGKPVPIFGDGSTGRDYTYVDDIAAGVLAALDHTLNPADGTPFEIFSLGNSHPVKLAGRGTA
ncbi:MAG TPA: NAD-dependent epimerase/dehydratase family protein [Terriglobales bacterium]|nr:NAD-dependent epimerase/dehydratase family protein [Terriglobales bacterium]